MVDVKRSHGVLRYVSNVSMRINFFHIYFIIHFTLDVAQKLKALTFSVVI